MDVIKSHAEIQRAYRLRLKQQNPELLRMREREKWRRQSLKKRSQHKNAESQSHNMAMERQDNRNHGTSRHIVSEEYPVDVKHNAELSAQYPIHDLLRWLENVEVDDSVKYRFLKYIYTEKGTTIESPSAYTNGSTDTHNSFTYRNTGAAEGEGQDLPRWRYTPNEDLFNCVNDRKRISIESSSESGVSDTHHENAKRRDMLLRRKSAKKMRNKKTSKRKNIVVKQRKHVTWEPLWFDDNETDE